MLGYQKFQNFWGPPNYLWKWYMIFYDFLSDLQARYDKKWKILQLKSENPEKKSKIFGSKNYELDILGTVIRPQEHDALGWKIL